MSIIIKSSTFLWTEAHFVGSHSPPVYVGMKPLLWALGREAWGSRTPPTSVMVSDLLLSCICTVGPPITLSFLNFTPKKRKTIIMTCSTNDHLDCFVCCVPEKPLTPWFPKCTPYCRGEHKSTWHRIRKKNNLGPEELNWKRTEN